jgi:hypothetical protein
MIKRAGLLAGLLAVFFGGEATALSRRIFVERDKPATAGAYYTIRRDCYTKAAQVAVVEAPKHGSLTFKEGDWTITPGIGVVDRCLGRTARAFVGTYVPAKGFTGPDTYRLRATYASDALDYDVEVVVREPRATKDPAAGGWTAPR